MKKIVLCVFAFFILFNVAGAVDREYYILKKDTLVFANVSHLMKFIDLAGDGGVGTEFYMDLTGKNMALMTNEDLIVYKFDKIKYMSYELYRIKVKNNCKIKYTNFPKELVINQSFKENEILGWVTDLSLKKVKKAK